MAHAVRALWPLGRALPGVLAIGLRWDSTRRAGPASPGQPEARAPRYGLQGGPRLLGAAALALGWRSGLYHTARWHLRTQDLRAERSATQVSLR